MPTIPSASESSDVVFDDAADFAARSSALVLANGGTVTEANNYGRHVMEHTGAGEVEVDASYGTVTVQWAASSGLPKVRMERVDSYGFDYGVLTATSNIVADYVDSRIDLPEARKQLDNIGARSKFWSPTVLTVATALAGAAAPLIYGGDWIVSIAGVFAYLILMQLMQLFGKIGLPNFLVQIIGGVWATSIAAIMRLVDPQVNPTSVVISIIIIIMAGMASTSAVQDTISGHYMHGLGRIFEGVVNTIGLVVGVRLGVQLYTALGAQLPVTNDVQFSSFPLWIMLLAAAFVAVGTGIILQTPPRVLFPAAALAMVVYAVYYVFSTGQGADAWARAVAAFAGGLGTVLLTRLVKAPASAMAITTILVLLPGTLLYQGIWGTSAPGGQAVYYLVSFALAALSLATGLVVGQYVGDVILNGLHLVKNRIFSPSFPTNNSSHPMSQQSGTTSKAPETAQLQRLQNEGRG